MADRLTQMVDEVRRILREHYQQKLKWRPNVPSIYLQVAKKFAIPGEDVVALISTLAKAYEEDKKQRVARYAQRHHSA